MSAARVLGVALAAAVLGGIFITMAALSAGWLNAWLAWIIGGATMALLIVGLKLAVGGER